MSELSPEKLLGTAIDRLRTERATLMSRVSEIDASLMNEASPDPKVGITALIWWLLRKWHDWCSLFSFPVFQPQKKELDDFRTRLLYRDSAVVLCFVASILVWFVGVHTETMLRMGLGLAFYRLIDLTITFVSLGVFGVIRDRPAAWQISRWRLQRMVILVFLNYGEMIFWFSVVYLVLQHSHPEWFGTCDTWSGWQAFLLSSSTVSTVGYGNVAPGHSIPVALTFWQSVLGVLALVTVLGSLVGLLVGKTEVKDEDDLQYYQEPKNAAAHWISPLLVLIVVERIVRYLCGP